MPRGPRLNAASRKRSNPDPILFDHDDRSLSERLRYSSQVSQQERCLQLGSALRGPAEEDHGRGPRVSKREEGPEIRVGGYDHASIRRREIENLFIRRRTEVPVADVNRIVAVGA